MNRLLMLILATALLLPTAAGAVTEKDFEVDTAQNLYNLCAASTDDPLYKEAIHMCYGFLLGAYAYHVAESSGPDGHLLVCLPNPEPSRNESVKMFVEWLKAHPERMGEEAVEVEFRFLMEKWPCKN